MRCDVISDSMRNSPQSTSLLLEYDRQVFLREGVLFSSHKLDFVEHAPELLALCVDVPSEA